MNKGSKRGQFSGAAPSPSSMITVDTSKIVMPTQSGALNEDVVGELAVSIKRAGLLNPLLVTEVPRADAFLLVAGAHRLAALRRLNWPTAQVIVRTGRPYEVEMDHLEENLVRKELPVLERALQERRLRELYIQEHPETMRGRRVLRPDMEVQTKTFRLQSATLALDQE